MMATSSAEEVQRARVVVARPRRSMRDGTRAWTMEGGGRGIDDGGEVWNTGGCSVNGATISEKEETRTLCVYIYRERGVDRLHGVSMDRRRLRWAFIGLTPPYTESRARWPLPLRDMGSIPVLRLVPRHLLHGAARGCPPFCACLSSSSSSPPPPTSDSPTHTATDGVHVIDERVAYHNFATVYQRTVRYPDDRQVTFDILGQPAVGCASVLVFPFCTRTQRCHAIREYCPGLNSYLYGFPAGMTEAKHRSFLDAARAELSEEAHLISERWIELTAACRTWNADAWRAEKDRSASGDGASSSSMAVSGLPADKYSKNVCKMFMALDPQADPSPGALDAEESIQRIGPVSLEQLRQWMREGLLTMPHMLLAMYSLDYLRRHSMLSESA
eukprot:ctg_64.g22